MPKARSPNRDKAYEIYKEHEGKIENRKIAEILGISEKTVGGWKCKDKWDQNFNGVLQTKKRSTPKKAPHSIPDPEEEKMQEAEASELSVKQQEFCIWVAYGDSAVSAYQKAYGCSYSTAAVQGSRALKKPKIKAEVDRLREERFKCENFGKHDIFQWYLDVARANITDFVEFGREEVQAMGQFGPIVDKETKKPVMKEINYVKFKQSSEVNGHLIKRVKMGKDGASIELYDAMKAMEWLTDHMSMGTEEQQSVAASIINAHKKRREAEEHGMDGSRGSDPVL